MWHRVEEVREGGTPSPAREARATQNHRPANRRNDPTPDDPCRVIPTEIGLSPPRRPGILRIHKCALRSQPHEQI